MVHECRTYLLVLRGHFGSFLVENDMAVLGSQHCIRWQLNADEMRPDLGLVRSTILFPELGEDAVRHNRDRCIVRGGVRPDAEHALVVGVVHKRRDSSLDGRHVFLCKHTRPKRHDKLPVVEGAALIMHVRAQRLTTAVP